MNSGFYAATTGLVARMQALDVAANNLANASTAGFKSQREFYRQLQANMSGTPSVTLIGTATSPAATQINHAINNFGVLGGAKTDFSTGSFEQTGNDLDVAVEGSGFITVETASGTRYTRNGQLQIGAHGELLTSSGDAVIGKNGPIKLPPGQTSIGADGSISVDGKPVDQLHIAEFDPAIPLVPLGGTLFAAPDGAENATAKSSVRQGFLEQSNMSTVAGGANLVQLQREAEMLQKALTIFHTEFNGTAASEVGKV